MTYQDKIRGLQNQVPEANDYRYSCELALEAHAEEVNAWEYRQAYEQANATCMRLADELVRYQILEHELIAAIEKGIDAKHFMALQEAYVASPSVIVSAKHTTRIGFVKETLTTTYKIIFPSDGNRPLMHDLIDVVMNWDNEVEDVEIYGQGWC